MRFLCSITLTGPKATESRFSSPWRAVEQFGRCCHWPRCETVLKSPNGSPKGRPRQTTCAADWRLEGSLYGGVGFYADRPEVEPPQEIARWVEDLQALPTEKLAAMACGGGEDLPADLLGLLRDSGYFADHVLIMNSCEPHDPTLRWHRRFLSRHLLRDIFGNPFRPVTVNLVWRSASVVSLAQAIYEERAFERLPILGDALEDAGCANADILAHCRGPGPHVRGCWVVDHLLQKT